ncbi:MAG: hypothetical protein HY900_20790 [Deltaproteobacteria bacterium]|nr:hypothetical protein [Deltaproteobacteria bacterium]
MPSSSASVSTSLGRARADVDLATGTLRASVATFSTGVAPDRGAEVRAGAIFQDRFTFHGNEATWLTATMSVTGALHRDAGLSNNLLTFGDPGLAQDLLPSAEAADLVINTTQAMVYYAIPNEPFELGATLAAWGYGWDGGNVSVDFSNTARLSFQLPEGAWITSEGGFSQDGSPVPLPSTLLLLGFRSFRLDALDEARARARCSGSSSREI